MLREAGVKTPLIIIAAMLIIGVLFVTFAMFTTNRICVHGRSVCGMAEVPICCEIATEVVQEGNRIRCIRRVETCRCEE